MTRRSPNGWRAKKATHSPRRFVIAGRLAQRLRYGENPHQAAAFYRTGATRPGVATARQLQGKELSYNNYADADAAFELVAEFAEPAVAIVKHANPCGVAIGATLREAWDKALACDPVSAFGGVVALNRPLDLATAEAIGRPLCRSADRPRCRCGSGGEARFPHRAAAFGHRGDARPAAAGVSFRSVAGGYSGPGARPGIDSVRTGCASSPAARRARPRRPICCSPTAS